MVKFSLTWVENFSILAHMKHLIPHWMDIENSVSIGDPDDFILPEDDDGGEQRQADTDLNRELKSITKELDRLMKLQFAKKQAD